MGKVKRESIEPLGTGLVLWQNQSKFQWSDRPANIPNGITEIGYKRWKNVVVGYFLDRALPLNLVKEWAYKTWEQALEDVMLLDNGFYVFKLRSEENCNAVLGVGPYHIAGKLLILKKCQPTGRASLQKQLCYTTSTMRVSNFAIICIEIQASFVDTLDGGMITRGCGTSDGGGDFMILEAGFTKLCGNGNADGGGDCTVVDGAFLAFIFSSGTMYCFI
uniref:DUF4283 domain-containing protein n=1 Tax=Salix viminalis TaxID=40686 RepID=A0A6N2N0N0_SALVM